MSSLCLFVLITITIASATSITTTSTSTSTSTSASTNKEAQPSSEFPFPIFRIPIRIHPLQEPQKSKSEEVMNPFIASFIKNQRQGFAFPDGEECEEDAHRLCSGLLKKCIGDFGCTTQCLSDHAPHLSEKCRKAHPCYPDMDQFCSQVSPGQNQMMHCLKAHKKELNPECLKIHPCLNAADDDQSCEVLDYSGKPPTFIKNIRHFLQSLRQGRMFNPFRQLLHPISSNNRHVTPLPHQSPDSSARAIMKQQQQMIQKEQQQIQHEREELLQEREELEHERASMIQQLARRANSNDILSGEELENKDSTNMPDVKDMQLNTKLTTPNNIHSGAHTSSVPPSASIVVLLFVFLWFALIL